MPPSFHPSSDRKQATLFLGNLKTGQDCNRSNRILKQPREHTLSKEWCSKGQKLKQNDSSHSSKNTTIMSTLLTSSMPFASFEVNSFVNRSRSSVEGSAMHRSQCALSPVQLWQGHRQLPDARPLLQERHACMPRASPPHRPKNI